MGFVVPRGHQAPFGQTSPYGCPTGTAFTDPLLHQYPEKQFNVGTTVPECGQ